MPVVQETASELLKDGFHRGRHPEAYVDSLEAPAYEARLRALRERKNPPLPSWSDLLKALRDAWREGGKAWEAQKADRNVEKPGTSSRTVRTVQL